MNITEKLQALTNVFRLKFNAEPAAAETAPEVEAEAATEVEATTEVVEVVDTETSAEVVAETPVELAEETETPVAVAAEASELDEVKTQLANLADVLKGMQEQLTAALTQRDTAKGETEALRTELAKVKAEPADTKVNLSTETPAVPLTPAQERLAYHRAKLNATR